MTNVRDPLHRGVQAIAVIAAKYRVLADSTKDLAVAIVENFPGQWATIELMEVLVKLTSGYLKSITGEVSSNEEVSSSVLKMNCQVIQNYMTGKPITLVRKMELTEAGNECDNDQNESDSDEIQVSSSSNLVASPQKRRKRIEQSIDHFPTAERLTVEYLHVLANKINQEVETSRIRQCKTIEELERLKQSPMLSEQTKSLKLSQSFIKQYRAPIVRALNSKLLELKSSTVTMQNSSSSILNPAEASMEMEQQVFTQETEPVIMRGWTSERFNTLPQLSLNPVDKSDCKNPELRKLRMWAEEVCNFFLNQQNEQ